MIAEGTIRGRENTIVYGLAGTGKSTCLLKAVDEAKTTQGITNGGIQYIAFNKLAVKKARDEFPWSYDKNTNTFHGYILRIVKELYPEYELNLSNLDEAESRVFDKLVGKFNKIPSGRLRGSSTVRSLRMLIIDEVQDFRIDYLEAVKKLAINAEGLEIILFAGDPHQQIYNFGEKKAEKRLIDMPVDLPDFFGDAGYKEEFLRVGYRFENRDFIRFYNGFLAKGLGLEEQFRYTYKEDYALSKKPEIHLFSNREDEVAFVKKKIGQLPEDVNAVVLSRKKLHLKPFMDLEIEGRVRVETIHQMKGLEESCVFVVGLDLVHEQDVDFERILNTAITRAKRELYITSSFPIRGLLDEYFESDTYILEDNQKSITEPLFIRARISEKKKKYSVGKLTDRYIDSLVFRVSDTVIPFAPHVIKNDTKQYRFKNTYKTTSKEGLEYSISKHHPSGNYYFHFKDLNPLKKNSFSDLNIVRYCLNEIHEYFDGRIDWKDIILSSVDLNSFLQFDSEKDRRRFLREEFFPLLIKGKNVETIIRDDGFIYYSGFNLDGDVINHNTLYINRYKNKGYTLVLYDPKNKENENRIHIRNLLKIELRMNLSYLKNEIVLHEDITAKDVLELCKDEKNLESLYERSLNDFLGKDTYSKVVKIHGLNKDGGLKSLDKDSDFSEEECNSL